MIRFILSLIVLIIFLSCETPFSTKPSNEENLFVVSHNYDQSPVFHKTAVEVSWSNITVENFKEFRIEKAKIIGDDYIWTDLARILDSLETSYIDTLDDDGTFQYRVRVIDQRDQYRYELSEQFSVPNVSCLYIPDHYNDLETSYYTKFIDNGDSIVFRPGVHVGNHNLINKNVVITSTHGPIITILSGINIRESVVRINRGRLQNLGIQNGKGLAGGGLWAGGSVTISNCFIKSNIALEDPDANMQIYPSGHGGGVFITDTAMVENCKILYNRARRGGGAVALDKFGVIRNCILFKNINDVAPSGEQEYPGGGIFVSDHSFGVTIQNCRLTRNRTENAGGGIFVDGLATITNCIMNYNYGKLGGGGVSVGAGNLLNLENCTLYRNGSHNLFSKEYSVSAAGDIDIINCIISRGELVDRVNNKFYAMNSTYSLIREVTNSAPIGNLVDNPLFIDPENSNFKLEDSSPAINAGHPGNQFKDSNGSRNDMGAYGGPYGDSWD